MQQITLQKIWLPTWMAKTKISELKAGVLPPAFYLLQQTETTAAAFNTYYL